MRRLVAALLALALLFVGGCGSRLELNEQAIVGLIGVDLVPRGGLTLSVRLVVPKLVHLSSAGSGAAGKIGTVFSSTGENFADAAAKLQRRVSRRLLWMHAGALVLSEAYARQGVRPTLDYLARHGETSLDLLIITTPGQAEALLRRDPVIEVGLTDAVKRLAKLESMPKVTLKSFLWALEKEGEEPVTASFMIDPQGGVLFNGSAVYRDDRLVRWLNPDETHALLWFWGQLKEEVITVPIGGTRISVTIHGGRSIRARLRAGRPEVRFKMSVIAAVLEEDGLLELDNVGVLDKVEETVAQYLTRRAERLMALLKREGLDSLRLASYVERADPRGWVKRGASWPKEFTQLPVQVEVNVSIKRTGRMIRRPGHPHPPQGGSR